MALWRKQDLLSVAPNELVAGYPRDLTFTIFMINCQTEKPCGFGLDDLICGIAL
jgi:hypothetical protein